MTTEASEAEPLRLDAPSVAPRACARLPCALAVGAAAAAAAAAAHASWPVGGRRGARFAGGPVSASQEDAWVKTEDTVCTNFDDIKVGGAMVNMTVPACISECQKSAECAAVSYISGADWAGSGDVGSGACYLLGAGCQGGKSGLSEHWHLYTPESAEAEAEEKGVWEAWPKTGCGNWDALRLGDRSVTSTLGECQALCASMPGCYGVNYQPEECDKASCPRCAPGEPPAHAKGACYVYGMGSEREGCQQGENTCWDLHIKSGPRTSGSV